MIEIAHNHREKHRMSLTKEHKRKISQGVREAKKRGEKLSNKVSDAVVLSTLSQRELEEKSGNVVSLARTRDVFKNIYLNLNPDVIRSILDSVKTGRLLDWIEFADSMIEGDPHLKGLINSRKSAISARDLRIVPASQDPRDVQVAEFVTAQIQKIDNLAIGLKCLQNGPFYGLGTVEMAWTYDKTNGTYFVHSLDPIPAKRFEIGEVNKTWQYMLSDYGQYPLTIENPVFKHPYKFIVHSPDDNELPHYRGLLRALAFVYYFKKLGIVYWVGGSEKHAFPPTYALVPPNTKPDALNKLVNNLYSLSNDGVAVIENTVQIKTIDGKATDGSAVYQDQLSYYDTTMSKLILGGTLVVEAASGPGGNRALGEVHERSKEEIIKADANALAETLQKSLVKHLLTMNKHLFGGTVPPLPSVKFDVQVDKPLAISQIHLQTRAVTINELRKASGLSPKPWGEERASFNGVDAPIVETEIVEEETKQETIQPVKEEIVKDEVSKEEIEKQVSQEVNAVDPQSALNGAQVTALLDIVGRVSEGLIPRATGVELMIAAFPIDREMAERIMGEVGRSFVPATINEGTNGQAKQTLEPALKMEPTLTLPKK